MDCKVFPNVKCPCAENCPNRAECENRIAENTPFLKELYCLHTFLLHLAKEVCDQQNKIPLYTYNEILCQTLWIFRGAIEKTATACYNLGDVETNFNAFETACSMWERTIAETEANFLREAFLPLRSQIRVHDFCKRGGKGDIFFKD